MSILLACYGLIHGMNHRKKKIRTMVPRDFENDLQREQNERLNNDDLHRENSLDRKQKASVEMSKPERPSTSRNGDGHNDNVDPLPGSKR